MIDSLSAKVKNSLIISKLEKGLPLYRQPLTLTTSSEAYRYYLYGEDARSNRDFPTARKMYSQALAIDSNFTLVTLRLSVACGNQGLYKQGKYEEALKVLEECWNSRVYYQHSIYLHLEAAKKAVADQKQAGIFKI